MSKLLLCFCTSVWAFFFSLPANAKKTPTVIEIPLFSERTCKKEGGWFANCKIPTQTLKAAPFTLDIPVYTEVTVHDNGHCHPSQSHSLIFHIPGQKDVTLDFTNRKTIELRRKKGGASIRQIKISDSAEDRDLMEIEGYCYMWARIRFNLPDQAYLPRHLKAKNTQLKQLHLLSLKAIALNYFYLEKKDRFFCSIVEGVFHRFDEAHRSNSAIHSHEDWEELDTDSWEEADSLLLLLDERALIPSDEDVFDYLFEERSQLERRCGSLKTGEAVMPSIDDFQEGEEPARSLGKKMRKSMKV